MIFYLRIILDASSAVSGYSSNIRLIPCSFGGYCLQMRPYLPVGASSTLITCTCENPHTTTVGGYQRRFSVNVWCGIVDNHVLGPHVLPLRLTGQLYRQFVGHELPDLLHEDVPLATRNSIWFMHDGAPAHFSHVAREYLDVAYPNLWMGLAESVVWPPR